MFRPIKDAFKQRKHDKHDNDDPQNKKVEIVAPRLKRKVKRQERKGIIVPHKEPHVPHSVPPTTTSGSNWMPQDRHAMDEAKRRMQATLTKKYKDSQVTGTNISGRPMDRMYDRNHLVTGGIVKDWNANAKDAKKTVSQAQLNKRWKEIRSGPHVEFGPWDPRWGKMQEEYNKKQKQEIVKSKTSYTAIAIAGVGIAALLYFFYFKKK